MVCVAVDVMFTDDPNMVLERLLNFDPFLSSIEPQRLSFMIRFTAGAPKITG
jgi:hypothetical protein